MTVVYLMRHSIASKNIDFSNENGSFQDENKKFILSIDGERKAFLYSKLKELNGINTVVSSNYIRAISTAKYIAEKNKIPVKVDSAFDEREFGVDDKNKIPNDFFKKQFLNHNYKLEKGESFQDVKNRAIKGLVNVIKNNYGKKSLIVTHSSTITFLLSKWCDAEYSGKYIIKFKEKIIVDGFSSPDLLELKFNEKNKLVNIRRIILNSKTSYNHKSNKQKRK